MNLVSFSIRTKGIHNFVRRLWTVFTRFGISEAKTQKALHTVIEALKQYNSTPTFYIPAVVLGRHTALITEVARSGAEIGIHGYVHNDYRSLSKNEQYKQTKQAISVFERTQISYQGFRNPYLGWTEETLEVFAELGFMYESNEAVIHDVIDLEPLSPLLRLGYEKSLELFQAIPCTAFTLRPHFEGEVLRIPISIPDDEMVFDRLRITNVEEVGDIWSGIMQRVYNLGGLYVLNLHPERAALCKHALDKLLSYACSQPLPVWVACLQDIAQWWKERRQFRLTMTLLAPGRWRIEADCTLRATLLARNLMVEDQPTSSWSGNDVRVQVHHFTVSASRCPCIGLSSQTPQQVLDFLLEQGYPAVYCSQDEDHLYTTYLDMPEGLGTTHEEQIKHRSMLVQKIEQMDAPFLHFGCWPNGNHAALAISGDIDSVTVQDFFLRVFEVT
ncbi:MAG: polysaccharide deacetylase family protein [Ktedonobacteraceae bacterium]